MREFIVVDPGDLHLPPSRSDGADPLKLARQIPRYGTSLQGMPPLELIRGRNGLYRVTDGVTRATRAAKLRPGELVPAEVVLVAPNLAVDSMPRVRDKPP